MRVKKSVTVEKAWKQVMDATLREWLDLAARRHEACLREWLEWFRADASRKPSASARRHSHRHTRKSP
jgi:hypothetical protein